MHKAASAAEAVAAAYGIEVLWSPVNDVPFDMRGPQGHGCDPARRRVYFTHSTPSYPAEASPEGYLHEVMHVVLHCPWGECWTIDDIPEDIFLLQFERAIAREYMISHHLRRVIEWQGRTLAHMNCFDELWSRRGYRYSLPWRNGIKIGQILGLLDGEGRPTLVWPRWSNLRKYKKGLESYFLKPGPGSNNPYPRLG